MESQDIRRADCGAGSARAGLLWNAADTMKAPAARLRGTRMDFRDMAVKRIIAILSNS